MERRQGVELRADGRTIIGPVVRYGDVSPSHRERFTPGSLTPQPDLVLNLGHDPMRAIAFGDLLKLEDRADALIGRARLPVIPAADAALDGVKSGRYNGYSSEFVAKRDFRDAGGVRVIVDADLGGGRPGGLAIVHGEHDRGPEAHRRGQVFDSVRQEMDCRCADGCTESVIETKATIDVSETAIAIRRGYAEALASRSKGTMRVLVDDDGIHLDLDLPDTTYARDLLEAADNVPLIVRPVVDFATSRWVRDGTLARFSRLVTPAFVVGFQ